MRLGGASDRDFVRMGRGIEDRYARCAAYWESHLTLTRTFIDQHTEPAKRVAVLGAGRLLDLDLPRLLERVEEVHLFDADPQCVKAWRTTAPREFRKRVIPRIEDVTGCLAEWSDNLKCSVRSGTLHDYLDSLDARAPRWSNEHFDGVVSLNLAGQIPLYWRDRVLSVKSDLSNEEAEALVRSYERLQLAHLAAVTKAAAHWALVITDVEYYFYESQKSEWEVEEALHGTARKTFAGLGNDQDSTSADCWLWHLAPQFIESDIEGEIHRVEARVWHNPTRL